MSLNIASRINQAQKMVNDHLFKVLVIGYSSVRKTSLLQYYANFKNYRYATHTEEREKKDFFSIKFGMRRKRQANFLWKERNK